MKYFFFFLFFMTQASSRAEATQFFIRLENSDPKEFQTALAEANQKSYVDWLITQSQKKSIQLASLDTALENSYKNPSRSLQIYRKNIDLIYENILNSESREVLVTIYQKIIKLKIPKSISQIYKERIHQLVLIDRELTQQPEFQKVLNSNKSQVQSSNKVLKAETDFFVTKWKKSQNLADAVFLVDGIEQKINKMWQIPNGFHQWTILSNTYLPLTISGPWSHFLNEFLKADSLKKLASGHCSNQFLEVQDHEIQNQAFIFYSQKCTPIDSQNLLTNRHLSPMPEIHSSKSQWWIPALIVLGAGAAYVGLKDKSVSVSF